MSRLTQVIPASMNSDQRELFELITGGQRGKYGLDDRERIDREGMRGPFNAWLHVPAMGIPAQALGDQLRFSGALSDRQREIAILCVAAHWQADYEAWAHAKIAAVHGVETEVIDAILAGDAPALADESERIIHEFVVSLLREHRVSDAVFGTALDHCGEAVLVELVMVMGYYVMVAATLNAFEVALPSGERSPFQNSP